PAPTGWNHFPYEKFQNKYYCFQEIYPLLAIFVSMKLLKNIAIAALLLVAACSIYGYFYYQSLKPTYKGSLTLEGLDNQVEVYFDKYGIPHIYAQSETDAQFALGYVHAQDRLWQLELIRRLGKGQLAEILGEPVVKTDRFFRTINSYETVKKTTKAFHEWPDDDPVKQATLAYYEGVNQFIKNGPTPIEFQILGIEKEELSVEDCYAVLGYTAFSFAQAFRTDPIVTNIQNKWGTNYLNDLDVHWHPDAQMIPVYSPKAITDALPDEVFGVNELFESFPVAPWIGSNSWIISGQKTKSGKTIFTNDTHIGFSQPSVWYEAHINYPGHNGYGNYMAGVPFPVIGHNSHTAMGLTMFENDDIDFYIEKLNPDNPNQVWFKDHWEDLDVRQEVIKVKGGQDVTFEVKTSRHGPIMNDAIDAVGKMTEAPVAAWWIYNKFIPNNLQTTYQFSHAKNIDEARAAASEVIAPGLNGMYADVEGNIAWWAMAKLPIRADHVNSKLFLDGASGEDEILGYLDFKDNPQAENPPEGYVYSANNQPDTTNGILHAGYYIPEDRATRITELLAAKDDWDISNTKAMITEVISKKKPQIVDKVLRLLDLSEMQHEHADVAINVLKNWNGDNQIDDIAPTIFAKLQYKLLELTCSDELGKADFKEFLNTVMSRRSLPFLLDIADSPWWDNQTTKDQVESRAQIVTAAFEQTLNEITDQLGDDISQWTWGKVHTIEHPHALGQNESLRPYFNVGPFPVKGNKEVINNMSYTINGMGKYEVVSGPAIRRIIDMGNVERSWNVLPTGNSGNVLSPHYDDQAKIFVEGDFRMQLMDKDDIVKESCQLVLNKK
ncbi:MAG: penicillin acylase family protein, partial [Bacteroidota bacterium]